MTFRHGCCVRRLSAQTSSFLQLVDAVNLLFSACDSCALVESLQPAYKSPETWLAGVQAIVVLFLIPSTFRYIDTLPLVAATRGGRVPLLKFTVRPHTRGKILVSALSKASLVRDRLYWYRNDSIVHNLFAMQEDREPRLLVHDTLLKVLSFRRSLSLLPSRKRPGHRPFEGATRE